MTKINHNRTSKKGRNVAHKHGFSLSLWFLIFEFVFFFSHKHTQRLRCAKNIQSNYAMKNKSTEGEKLKYPVENRWKDKTNSNIRKIKKGLIQKQWNFKIEERIWYLYGVCCTTANAKMNLCLQRCLTEAMSYTVRVANSLITLRANECERKKKWDRGIRWFNEAVSFSRLLCVLFFSLPIFSLRCSLTYTNKHAHKLVLQCTHCVLTYHCCCFFFFFGSFVKTWSLTRIKSWRIRSVVVSALVLHAKDSRFNLGWDQFFFFGFDFLESGQT